MTLPDDWTFHLGAARPWNPPGPEEARLDLSRLAHWIALDPRVRRYRVVGGPNLTSRLRKRLCVLLARERGLKPRHIKIRDRRIIITPPPIVLRRGIDNLTVRLGVTF